MNRSVLSITAATTLVALAACSSGGDASHEAIAVKSSAIVNSGTVPYPVKVKAGQPDKDANGNFVPAWDGSVIDLLAADAWSQCGGTSNLSALTPNDKYITYLELKMSSMACTPPPIDGSAPPPTLNTKAGNWAKQRLDSRCNIDPSTGQLKAVKMTFPTAPSPIPSFGASFDPAAANAQLEVDSAEVNLCMAQRLRETSVSGDALVLAASDQRLLLEVTRERAQVAMLQYAALGVAFAQPAPALTAPLTARQVLPLLAQWSHSSVNGVGTRMADLGTGLASAAQLHTIVSRELAEILWRSSSAKMPRGGYVRSTGEELWGPGSWRQRLMASLYGGDPLVQWTDAQPPSPWTHYIGKSWLSTSDVPLVSWPGWGLGDPQITTADARAPEVSRLLGLARSANVLDLRIGDYPAGVDASHWDQYVDTVRTSHRLYRAVEASLRLATCQATGSSTCDYLTILGTILDGDASTIYESYELWKRYRIRPSHADTLTAALAELIPHVLSPTSQYSPAGLRPGALRTTGPETQVLTGANATARLGSGTPGNWYHLDPKATFEELDLVDRAPGYTRATAYRMPTSLDLMNAPETQGFVTYMKDNESVRVLGAVSALVATREALRIAKTKNNVSNIAFFQRSEKVLDVIDGAAGQASLSVRPVVQTQTVTDSCWNANGASGPCPELLQKSSGTTLDWEVDVSLPIDHPMATAAKLVVAPSGLLASELALRPTAQSFLLSQNTIAAIVLAYPPKASDASGTWTRSGTIQYSQSHFTVSLPVGDWSFILQSSDGTSYYPLAESLSLRSKTFGTQYKPSDGQYIAYSGVLGTMARHAWAAQRDNWSQPQYDGYGLPLRWVPPSDPSLFGGESGDNAVTFNLRSAKDAANQATDAVKLAIDELLREQADDATLAQAQKRASGIAQIEQRSLCGDSNPMCSTATTKDSPRVASTFASCPTSPLMSLPGIEAISSAVIGQNHKAICDKLQESNERILSVSKSKFELGQAVWSARNQASPPDFADYRGGQLQALYLEQWLALKRVENAGREVNAVTAAVWSDIDGAFNRSAFQTYRAAMACTRDIAIAAAASIKVTAGFINNSITFEPGPLLQAAAACQDALVQQGLVGGAELSTAIKEGFARMATHMMSFTDAVGTLQESAVKGQRVLQETKLAKAHADLESQLAGDTVLTKFGMYRRYHSYDMWRARALLESARRYAVTARRAIESRYVVDLSQLDAAEPYVAPPTSWADEIYEYDLDAPSAVGLVALPQQAGGLYPNRLADYIGNLERFVAGYAIARPTSTVKHDDDILTLRGPEDRTTITDNGQPVSVLSTDAMRWEFFCPTANTWRRHPAAAQRPATAVLADVCTPEAPTRARVTFGLDPWGRVDGTVANEPYVKRHNARWVRMALNLVGTGVVDCTRAADPQSCFTQAFVRYDLAHTGPAWVTNYEQEWRTLGMSFGRIESGKALAAEEWLDPINNGWGKPYVEAVAREELVERPLGGGYTIELVLAPEVRPEKIEDLQVLLQSAYWVKQQ